MCTRFKGRKEANTFALKNIKINFLISLLTFAPRGYIFKVESKLLEDANFAFPSTLRLTEESAQVAVKTRCVLLENKLSWLSLNGMCFIAKTAR